MSETDHSTSALSPEQVVRARLVEGRLFEARFLLKRIGSEPRSSAFRELEDRIEKDVSQVRELVQRAEDLVRKDRLDDAVAAYDAVRSLAVDCPGLDQALKQLQVRRSLGPLQAVGRNGQKHRIEPGRHERGENHSEKNSLFARSGRFPRIAVLGSVVGLAVLVTLAGILFQAASKTDNRPGVEFVEKNKDVGEVSLPPVPAPVDMKNNRAPQSSLLPEAIIAPPITDSLPVPELAEEKPGHADRKADDTGLIEIMPLPVFTAGQERIRVRFIPFCDESDDVQSVSAQDPDSKGDLEGELLAAKNEVMESHSGPDRNKDSAGREQQNPPKPAQPLALNPDGTYTVRPGDNLGGIALRLYGTSQRWREIFVLNRDILPTPATLRVGQHLKIRPDTEVSAPTEEDMDSLPELSEQSVSEGTMEERE